MSYFNQTDSHILVIKLTNVFLFFLEYSFDEIERILLLLLACSVSGGDRKDLHIEHLTTLNESIQQALMPHIEELTNEINNILQPQEYFFTDEINTDNDKRLKCVFVNLIHLIEQRDAYFEEILELEQDKAILKQKLDLYQSSSSNLINIGTNSCVGTTNLHSTPSQTSLNTFLNDLETKNPGIEITEYKTKMRQMKFDLDDKMDTIETMREEIELLQNEITRLKTENLELIQNTRLTRLYRDEIDSLNEKLVQLQKSQQDSKKYKERLNELDTYKNRIEELQNESKHIPIESIHRHQ